MCLQTIYIHWTIPPHIAVSASLQVFSTAVPNISWVLGRVINDEY